MVRIRALLAILLLAGLASATFACGSKEQPKLISAWPTATVERVVPKPPTPPRWPLTGLPAPSAAATKRRAMSVKIENSPEARPQTGLNEADVVYETVTEGGITRFNTLWHSKLIDVIGPVRSARLSDLWIVPQYNALFFFSGASTSVNRAVNAAGLPNLSEDAGVTYPYFRSASRAAPHNLYLTPTKAYEEAKRRKMKVVGPPKPLVFDRRSVAETPTVKSIFIPFSSANRVKWVYDSKTRTFVRYNNGVPHVDALNGKQVRAKNVVVLWANYRPISRDKVGSTTFDVVLGGSGRAQVFHNGTSTSATWRANRNAPPQFTDESGRPVKLAPGNTWFQVIPLATNITLQ